MQYNTVIVNLIDLLNFASVTSFANNSFYNCSSIRFAVLPPNLVTMNQRGFQGCTSLLVCTIPSTFRTFGDLAFYNSTRIRALIFFCETPPSYNRTLNSTGSRKVYVPDDSVEAYKAASGWSSYASSIYGHSQLAIDYPDYYEQYIHIYD